MFTEISNCFSETTTAPGLGGLKKRNWAKAQEERANFPSYRARGGRKATGPNILGGYHSQETSAALGIKKAANPIKATLRGHSIGANLGGTKKNLGGRTGRGDHLRKKRAFQ